MNSVNDALRPASAIEYGELGGPSRWSSSNPLWKGLCLRWGMDAEIRSVGSALSFFMSKVACSVICGRKNGWSIGLNPCDISKAKPGLCMPLDPRYELCSYDPEPPEPWDSSDWSDDAQLVLIPGCTPLGALTAPKCDCHIEWSTGAVGAYGWWANVAPVGDVDMGESIEGTLCFRVFFGPA